MTPHTLEVLRGVLGLSAVILVAAIYLSRPMK